jgi:hypothetical protein
MLPPLLRPQHRCQQLRLSSPRLPTGVALMERRPQAGLHIFGRRTHWESCEGRRVTATRRGFLTLR